VLSGFLLTKNFLDGQRLSQYFLRRLFRIAPLYFFVLTGVVVYQATGNYAPNYLNIKAGCQGAILHFLFLKGDGIFWTISAEFTFYLLLPLFLWAISRLGQTWLVIAAIAYFLWFALIQVLGVSLVPLKFVIINHNSQFLDVFACGILGAYVCHDLPKKIIAISFWGLLALTLLCVSKNFLGAGQLSYGLRWISILYGVVFTLGIVSATQGNRWIIVPLQSKIMVFMGITGFGWYSLHFPVLQMVNAYFEGSTAVFRFLMSVFVISVLAYTVLRIIESYFF